MQTRKQSAIETATSIVIGYVVAVCSQIIVFPMVGVESSIGQNLAIGGYFTVISFVRGYFVRRWFA